MSLWKQPIGGAPEKLQLGDVSPVPFAARDGLPEYLGVDGTTGPYGEIAFVGTTTSRAAELYVMTSPTAAPIRITDVNVASERWPLGRQETPEWATDRASGSPNGMRADGILTLPPGIADAEARPLLVMVHGGPGWAATRALLAHAAAARNDDEPDRLPGLRTWAGSRSRDAPGSGHAYRGLAGALSEGLRE